MNAFVPWIGGKTRLAKTIVAMLPKDRESYIEVFGGGAKVLFKKDMLPGEIEVYNDINSSLVTLFRVVRDRLPQFKRRQYMLFASREEYKAFLGRFRSGRFKDDIERAVVFYYLVKNSFGSGVTTGWGFSKVRPPKYPACLESLEDVQKRLTRVYLECLSFEALIPKWDRESAVFYLDPPYYMLTEMNGSYYEHDLDQATHERLRDVLKGVKGRFILSYDDHVKVRELYRDFNVQITKPIHYSMNNRPGEKARYKEELLITNF